MSDYSAYQVIGLSSQTSSRAYVPAAQSFAAPIQPSAYSLLVVPLAPPVGAVAFLITAVSRGAAVETVNSSINGALQQYWFEHVHSWPAFIEIGNLLTTTTIEVELYNAFRNEIKSVSSFVNNADSGVGLSGFPALPSNINPSSGLVFDVVVLSSGAPDLLGTLVFVVGGATITIPISGTRVVIFPYQPETPIREQLEFATDIIEGTDGTEQRIRIRKNPRQKLWYSIKVEDDAERRRMSALLVSWHARSLGVPVWFEARYLTISASAGNTTIQVNTNFADFRVGALAIIWQSPTVFDALQISALDSTSITFSSSLKHDYEQAVVMPLRIAVMGSNLSRAKYTVGLEELNPKFTVLDNDSDLSDVSAFSTHNGKVMLDDANLMFGKTIEDGLTRKLEKLDNVAGNLLQFSDWAVSLPTTKKGFLANSAKTIWEVRQLLHALHGSQISFYLPTFYYDMVAVATLANGSLFLDIEHIGYSTYVAAREPNKSIHILLADGTVLTRQVVAYEELDATTERLTMDSAWDTQVLIEDIQRISFLRLCRIHNDRAEFSHTQVGKARISMTVRGLL